VIEFFYPGGHLTARKLTREVLRAFSQTPGESIRLVVKAQTLDRRRLRRHLLTAFPGTPPAGGHGLPRLVDILCDHVTRCVTKAILGVEAPDRRIRVIAADLPTVEYHRLFASCHVCLAPSRWEGLGLHLFESMAFGMPVISNDAPPANEVIRNGHNGLLVRSTPVGQTRSGVPAMAADVNALSRAIERLSNDAEVSRMSENAVAARERMSWESTCEQLAHLLEA
jgi:glycosyltransferase involved in cell wall biosynthesis